MKKLFYFLWVLLLVPVMASAGDWPLFGQDILNAKYVDKLSNSNDLIFAQRCKFINGYNPEDGPPVPTRPVIGDNTQRANGISSTPTIDGDTAYFTTWAGTVAAIDLNPANTITVDGQVFCAVLWEKKIGAEILAGLHGRPDEAPFSTERSRNSPALFEYKEKGKGKGKGNMIPAMLLGSPVDRSTRDLAYDNVYFALARDDGRLLWSNSVCDASDPWCRGARTTASASIHDDFAYGGLSGSVGLIHGANAGVEGLACTFRGKFFKIDLQDKGKLVWAGYTVPPNDGGPAEPAEGDQYPSINKQWCGSGVWGSAPPIDVENGLVFFTSGNLYHVPYTDVETCLTPKVKPDHNFTSEKMVECHVIAEGDAGHRIATDAVIAVRLDSNLGPNPVTGVKDADVAWYDPTMGLDMWTTGCRGLGLQDPNAPNFLESCPIRSTPDWDFGQAPIFIPEKDGQSARLVAISKSGVAFIWEANGDGNGNPVRLAVVNVAPGSTLGGGHWGASYNPATNFAYLQTSGTPTRSAKDFEMDNSEVPVTTGLTDGSTVCQAGVVTALNVGTGQIEWQNFSPYANLTGKPFPKTEENVCKVAKIDDGPHTTEKYKRHFEFFPDQIGGDVGTRNKCSLLFDPENPNADTSLTNLDDQLPAPLNILGSRFHGPPASTTDHVYVPSMHGIVFQYDATDGECKKALYCGEEPTTVAEAVANIEGGIYGGISLGDDEVLFGCGYAQIGFGGNAFEQFWGNMLRVYGTTARPTE